MLALGNQGTSARKNLNKIRIHLQCDFYQSTPRCHLTLRYLSLRFELSDVGASVSAFNA